MQEVKRGFRFYVKIYGMIFSQDLKSKMSYRADFIISTLGMIFSNISGFVTFWILFQNFPTIMGWNYHEMLFFYGFSLLALTPVQCFFDNNWNLRRNVFSGDFIKYYFRPINMFFYYQSEGKRPRPGAERPAAPGHAFGSPPERPHPAFLPARG